MNWHDAAINFSNISMVFQERFILIKNDINLKPDWVSQPAENTEFHLLRNKENLTLVIGESWTYGESLPGIATGVQKYNVESQLIHCFGPKLSLLLDTDFYQYAVPGNCNAYMIMELERILDHIQKNYSYKNIYLFFQLTEPSREKAISKKLNNTKFSFLYNFNGVMTIEEWLTTYDDNLLTIIDDITNKHSNLKVVIWKNFCAFQNIKKFKNFKLVQDSWIKFSAKFLGIDLEMQKFQSVGWIDDFERNYNKKVIFSKEFVLSELDKIERSNKFIQGNYLHNNHPNVIAHNLWALNLYKEFYNV